MDFLMHSAIGLLLLTSDCGAEERGSRKERPQKGLTLLVRVAWSNTENTFCTVKCGCQSNNKGSDSTEGFSICFQSHLWCPAQQMVPCMARKSGRERTPAKGRSSPGCHAWGTDECTKRGKTAQSHTRAQCFLFLAWMSGGWEIKG